MKQQHSASKSKRKISHDSAHRPQNKAISLPIHCVFMFRAPLQKSNFARRNAIAGIIDNRGRSQTQGGVRKNPLVAPKSQETGFGGCMPRSRQMSKVLRLIIRFAHAAEENNAISRNTKRFSEKQLDRVTRQETVIRNNGTDNFQTHFMLVFMSLPAPRPSSSSY